jgi:hypothetical protein
MLKRGTRITLAIAHETVHKMPSTRKASRDLQGYVFFVSVELLVWSVSK